MISRQEFFSIILLLLAFVSVSCSGGDPVTGVVVSPDSLQDSIERDYTPNHYLWNYGLVYVNTHENEFEIIPVRHVAGHWNILKFLEQGPCTDCLKITGVEQSGNGTVLIDIEITHPFDNANLTGFDVRGIAMFSGSYEFPASGLNVSDRWLGDGALVNADGYTTLYNYSTMGSGPGGLEGYIEGKLSTAATPDSLLNGFKRFISSGSQNTRNAFYSGDAITVTYEIDMPSDEFIFGYAVDASWAPAVSKPVQNPIDDFGPDANCPEAWKIAVTSTYNGEGLNASGGSAKLVIDVYDLQDTDTVHPVVIECPELFDGQIEGTWVSDGDGFSQYEAEVVNTNLALSGYYPVLVSKEAMENDPVGKPWLDLTAYQLFSIRVGWQENYPATVATTWLSFSPGEISVDGDILCAAAGKNGAILFDISDPENPYGVGVVDPTWRVSSVAVTGHVLTIASNLDYPYSKIDVADIDPPESAHIVKTLNSWGVVSGLTASGSAVCGRQWQQSMHTLFIIDVVPPSIADYVPGVNLGWGSYGDHSSADGYACVPIDGGFKVVDIDPPEAVHSYSTVLTEYNGNSAVSDGYAYLMGPDSGMLVADIDPPTSTYFVDIIDIPVPMNEMIVDDGYLYAFDDASLHIMDVVPPESSYLVNSIDLAGDSPSSIATLEGYTYVSDSVAGIQVFDTDPPESAHLVNIMETLSDASGVAVDGGYAYLADAYGLQIVDIDPVESASIVKSVDAPEVAMKVVISGSLAYVADGETGLLIVDIDPPDSAYILNTVDTPGYAWGVAVQDGYAYVADGAEGLQIIDVFPPESASVVCSVPTSVPAFAVATMDAYAYVADSDGLRIVDIDPPESAYILHGVDTPGSARGITISGDYVFLAHQGTWNEGLQIIDINPPEQAYIYKTINTYGWIGSVSVSGGYAYIPIDPGFAIYDIDPLDSMYKVKSFATSSGVSEIVILDNYAFLAGGSYGLRIVKLW